MNIKLHEVTIRDLFKGYKDSQEEGVVAYSGLLDIRPKYQRELFMMTKNVMQLLIRYRKTFL